LVSRRAVTIPAVHAQQKRSSGLIRFFECRQRILLNYRASYQSAADWTQLAHKLYVEHKWDWVKSCSWDGFKTAGRNIKRDVCFVQDLTLVEFADKEILLGYMLVRSDKYLYRKSLYRKYLYRVSCTNIWRRCR
jgi:hypothetical protein